jgi:hypothetical protein
VTSAKVERALRKAAQALERSEAAQARVRVREKRNEATRHYRLGLVLESFLFREPALLARVEALVQQESPRVRAAFSLHQLPSWFEQPRHDAPKKILDTRRYWLGMALERLLPGDAAVLARVKALMREQASNVRDAFDLEDPMGTSWFDRMIG